MKYTVVIQEHPYDSGELVINFPEEMINSLEWEEGDVIEWFSNGDGSYTLKRAYRREPIQQDLFGD